MLDVVKFVGEIQDYIARAIQPLADRILALESSSSKHAAPTADAVAAIVLTHIEADYAKRLADYERRFHEAMAKAIESMPKPLDGKNGDKGEPGADGKSFEYRGVFKDGEIYPENCMVTFGGSCWCAKRETGEKPGTSDAWVLAVKKGRDGKDTVKL